MRYSLLLMRCSSTDERDDVLVLDADRCRAVVRALPFWWCFCGDDFTCPVPPPFISRLSAGNRFVLCFLLICSVSFCGDADADMDADVDDMLPRPPVAGRPKGPLNEGVLVGMGVN